MKALQRALSAFVLMLIAAGFGLGQCTARAAVINAFDHDGTDSYAVLSDAGNARTQNGVDMTFFAIWNTDTLTPGVNGTLIQYKRLSNDAIGIALYFRDSNNTICVAFALANNACCGSILADTWYLSAAIYTNSTDTWVLRHFTMDGTQECTTSFTPTTSNFDDEQTQEVTFGAYEEAGTVLGELDGQSILQGFLYGVAKSQTDLSNYAISPLVTGDSWLASHGSSIFKYWFDSTISCPASVCTDVSGNAETLTLSGGATLGSSNGPDIPARAGGGGGGLLLRRMHDL